MLEHSAAAMHIIELSIGCAIGLDACLASATVTWPQICALGVSNPPCVPIHLAYLLFDCLDAMCEDSFLETALPSMKNLKQDTRAVLCTNSL